jgi:glycosyltransferase involved in cell wall biosynthesis
VSVVIPTRNRAGLVRSAINSVLAQDYQNLECIVVDGSSDDQTIEILRSYGDRIRWISKPDSGPAEAIETGWESATGEVLAWLNDDDLWLPGAVTAAVDALLRSSADVVYGSCLGIDLRDEIVWWERSRPWALEKAILNADHVINQPTAFMRREAVGRAGGLVRTWAHDHDLWIRIGLSGGTFLPLDTTLAAVRIHEGNFSMRPAFAHEQKLELIKFWMNEPTTPANIRSQRRRAISNAHLRGLHYLRLNRVGDWALAARFIGLAVIASPSNGLCALARLVKLARLRFQRGAGLRRIKEDFGPRVREASAGSLSRN